MFYCTCSPEQKIFLFFTGVNNEETNKFGMASLQNILPTLTYNIKEIIYFPVNNLDLTAGLSNKIKS